MGGPRTRIFVYGTLRRGGTRDVTRFYPGATFVAEAFVRGRLYHLGDYPGLRLDGGAGWVRGDLLDVTPAALAALDEWEGIDPARPAAGEYRRVRTLARFGSAAEEPCWVYEISPARCVGRPVITSGDWLAS